MYFSPPHSHPGRLLFLNYLCDSQLSVARLGFQVSQSCLRGCFRNDLWHLPMSFSYVRLVNKADCRSRSALRLLNLKRFPRTRAQVDEGWKRPRCKLHRLAQRSPCPPRCARPPYCSKFGVYGTCVYGCSESTVVLRHDVFIAMRGACGRAAPFDVCNITLFVCSMWASYRRINMKINTDPLIH